MGTKALESIPEIHPVIKFSALINTMEMLLPVELDTSMNRTSNIRRAWHTWTAFTVFPLVAGTAGPFSTALNICALVEPWRIDARGNDRTKWKFVDDPQWYVSSHTLNSFRLTRSLVKGISH
jgi:hypothetical protein